MKKVYVSSTKGDFDNLIFVWAENQEEAKEKIIEEMIKDDLFLDCVYDRSLDGYSGKLFKDKKGSFFNNYGDSFRKDIENKYKTEEEIDKYIEQTFRKNCLEYLGNEEWAKIYYDYFYDMDIEDGEIEYPYEMLKEIARKEAKEWNGFEPSILKIID